MLIAPGTYAEAVDVTTPNITIRGEDRNGVILDGGFELENGIRVLDTDGVVVENMTARNYKSNGFFWTGSDFYRGSYLTAYRNGDYGIYAFDAYHGQFDHSLGSGSPDAGFYIGECFPCDALITDVVSEYNGLGYSGTNSGGDLFIVNSTFRNNRAGIVPNSGAYELCYPERESTIVGNTVHDNNYLDGPGISVALLAQGNGILVPGGVRNTIERNLVFDHSRTGIGLVPYPEEDSNDTAPTQTEWDTPCEEVRDLEVPPIPPEQCRSVEGLLAACAVIWNPFENVVQGNVVSGSGLADLAVATIDVFGTGESVDKLRNCFSGNTFATTAPQNLEALAPCPINSAGSGDWTVGGLDLLTLLGDSPPKPPADSYKTTPEPGPQDNMPEPSTTPPARFTGPTLPDVATIAVPAMPPT
ncbi:MAG: right-handed parallel beta-helix repeat-containing protein [Actinomycetota bacterium]